MNQAAYQTEANPASGEFLRVFVLAGAHLRRQQLEEALGER